MIGTRVAWTLFALLVAVPAFADDSVPPPPPGWGATTPLDAADLNRKVEGGYFTGLPLANVDPNTGTGFGVRGYYYENGDRSNPLFAYTPYLYRVFLQAFFTTGGLQYHQADFDAPALFGTRFRLRGQFIFLRNTAQHFYGLGEQAMDNLSFTGGPGAFRNFSDYQDALDALRPDGTTLSQYDNYRLTNPISFITLERSLLDGLLRPQLGLNIEHSSVKDYTGDPVDSLDGSPIQGRTRLREACDAGLRGCGGGFHNGIRLGLSFDTRDFEPDPNNGLLIDTTLDVIGSFLGSDFNYTRFLVAARGYWSPFPIDLVFAARGTFQVQSKGTPFFQQRVVSYAADPRTGLGGIRTLRGYKQDRFVGRALTLLNVEARWTYYRFRIKNQRFALMLAAFADSGRVYDKAADLSLDRWRSGFGAASRVSWNLATIVTVEYGRSREDSGVYVNFSHQF